MPNLRLPLFVTRCFIFYFMLMWALDRFSDPEHASKVADQFYSLGPIKLSAIPNEAIGGILIIVLLGFLVGFQKRITYGLVLLFHALGTLFTLPNLLPFTDKFTLIFLAALPTIGAMWLLYALREQDTLLSLNK